MPNVTIRNGKINGKLNGDNPIKTFGKDSKGNAYLVSEEGAFKECIGKICVILRILVARNYQL